MSSPDYPSAMDISNQTGRQGTKQRSVQSNRSKNAWAEDTRKSLMKCPNCPAEIATSITFCKQRDDHCKFDIDLYQESRENHTPFFTKTIPLTKEATAEFKSKKECPTCGHNFHYQSHARSSNKNGEFHIELSIDISKDGKVEEKSAPKNNVGAGGTQSQKVTCDDERMRQNDMVDSPGVLKGSNTDDSALPSCLERAVFKSTADNKGWLSLLKSPMMVHCITTGDTFGAASAIMERLKNSLKHSKKLNECSIILVFCPVSRSFESEIKSAKEKKAVLSDKQFILVLMHHTRDLDYSTAGCDTSQELKNVHHVHVLYHETEKGLLKCKQNDMAIKVIENVLQTYKK